VVILRTLFGALAALAAGLVTIVIVVSAGWYPIGDGATPPTLPDLSGLDAWIADGESAAGVRSGLEARVVWHDPGTRERTPVSIVYLPGMGASPLETRPLADSVASDLGANLYYHRPAGHVLGENTMAGIEVGDWLADALEALAIGALLGERVVLMGMSNGGALATWAAIRHPDQIDALVLLSPNFGPTDPLAGLLTGPAGRSIAGLVLGETHTWTPENAAQAEAWDTAYPSAALVPMMRLSTWVDQRRRLRKIEAPTLVLYSPEDQVVDPGEIIEAAGWIGATPRRLVPVQGVTSESRHIIAGDAVSPSSTETVRALVTDFLVDVLGT